MNKRFKYKNRIFKRVISFTLVLALVLSGLPADLIPDDVVENAGIVMNVKAAEELDTLLASYTEHSYVFNSGENRLSEYSQCFQDAEWAEDHANDSLTLNPTAGIFIFDANYNPIGNGDSSATAFAGTIILNTSADDFAVQANTPIFGYVKDSVTIKRMNDNVNIPLNINRVADAGSTVSPLYANHVVGSGATNPYEWNFF